MTPEMWNWLEAHDTEHSVAMEECWLCAHPLTDDMIVGSRREDGL